MKKLIILLVFVFSISGYSFRKISSYVVTGQLYGTPRHGFPDRMKGKVYEVKYSAFWPKEEKGKIVPGKAITSSERGAFSLSQAFTEQYNTSGTITRFESFNDEDQVTSYWKTETDGKIILKAENFNMNHVRTTFTTNSYTGNYLTEVKLYRNENSPAYLKIVYEYDQNGNRTRSRTFSSNNFSMGFTEFSYNKEGNMEQTKVYSLTGNLISEFKFGFNKKGEKISQRAENFSKGTVENFSYEHEYDKKGNWIKEIFYRESKPFYIRVREIKYYE